jgi:hypothetical protein
MRPHRHQNQIVTHLTALAGCGLPGDLNYQLISSASLPVPQQPVSSRHTTLSKFLARRYLVAYSGIGIFS